MKNSAFVALATGLLLVTLMIAQGYGQNNQTVKYSTLIDEAIVKCQNKVTLLNSTSLNFYRCAKVITIDQIL